MQEYENYILRDQGLFNIEFLKVAYGSMARRFVYRNGNRFFAHVCVAQPIEQWGYFFSEPWLGYHDPYFNTLDSDFIEDSIIIYSEWCKSQGIIGELMRLNPVGRLHKILQDTGKFVLDTGQMVSITDIPKSPDAYLSSIENSCRRQIIKARKSFEHIWFNKPKAEDLLSLASLYSNSLDRCGAAPKWYLRHEDFSHLADLPCFDFLGVSSRTTGSLVAMAGVLYSGNMAHMLFVGCEDNKLYRGASDLLYYSTVCRAIQRQQSNDDCKHICFGGGRGTDSRDGLIRFKAKFSLGHIQPCTYVILKHDPVVLERLGHIITEPINPPSDPASQLKARHFPFLNSVQLGHPRKYGD
ncbi:hypothetical protein EXU57_23260 [Segetibacter sp. 3557_3]|uniref:hypothetical protein n=1 Tax=Segetibacter sp. 3557_3 TaxID=2547429 RepID=UPI001058C6A1|nr:hypothetical protein [Segetibacter sp. 3557_3]TDH18386.1 hypothetical protein EXU57_23260 [Segetibacter sp. 3557_3]